MTVKEQVETHQFEAEVKRVLDLVINSLYSKKEIFVRELISNASDAEEKLRQLALSDEALLEKSPDLSIKVLFNKDLKTITFIDNGYGMSRDEVMANLGTIANSGTQKFLDALSGDAKKDSSLIGQFGVGFYSAFVVAKQVVVRTRKAGSQIDQGIYWESDGTGEYQIKNIERPERGTEVTLHLKDGEEELCDYWRLKGIITEYSNHIQWPIFMEKKQVNDEGKETGEIEQEQVNAASALWTRSKSEISEDDYKKFYSSVSNHDYQDPLSWTHSRVEGKLEYTTLLYVPQKAPFDLFYKDHQRGLKLYIKRVFIMDDAEHLLPMYLRFIKGVVDANDLPLNVSREMLQSNRTIESIKSGCVKKILSMLESLAKKDAEKYQSFWKEFGQVLKEGVAEDFANKDRIAKLLRFASTHGVGGGDQTVSLEDYCDRMGDKQDKIYYIVAENHAAAASSPHLEIFKKKGVEVLILSDRVDEWLVAHMTEFEGKKLQSVAKGELDDLGSEAETAEKDTLKAQEKDYESMIEQMKKVLESAVDDVRLTTRLVDSPACLVRKDDQMSSHLERMMREAGQDVPSSKPILEVNPEHPLLKHLKDEQDDDRFSDLSHVIVDQALLAEGSKITDPAQFVKRLNSFIVKSL